MKSVIDDLTGVKEYFTDVKDDFKPFILEKIANVKKFVGDSVNMVLVGGFLCGTPAFAETYKIPQVEFEDSLVKGLFEKGLLNDRKEVNVNGKTKTVKVYNITGDTINTLVSTFSKMGKKEILSEAAEQYKSKSVFEKFRILKLRFKYYKKMEAKITDLSNSLDNYRNDKADIDELWNNYTKVLNTADFISVSSDLELSPDVLNEINALFSSYIGFCELEKYKEKLNNEYFKNKKILKDFITNKNK